MTASVLRGVVLTTALILVASLPGQAHGQAVASL